MRIGGIASSSAADKVPSYKFEDWQLLAAIPLGALQTATILIAAVNSFLAMGGVKYLMAIRKKA